MQIHQLTEFLQCLPTHLQHKKVYVNLKKSDYSDREQDLTVHDPELYCDILAVTYDVEDDCIVITGELS